MSDDPDYSVALAGTIIAFVVPGVLGFARLLSIADSVILGLLIEVFVLSWQGVIQTRQIKFDHRRNLALTQRLDAFERDLVRIHEAYSGLLEAEREKAPVFIPYFARSVSTLQTSITKANESGILALRDYEPLTYEQAIANFVGESSDVFLGIHFLENQGFLQSGARQRRINALVADGKIRAVRRIFVFDGPSSPQTQDARNQALIQFHLKSKGYECRLLSRDDFNLIAGQRGEVWDAGDAAVYGAHYAFKDKATGDARGSYLGEWIRGKEEVESLRQLFEDAWGSPSASAPAEDNATPQPALRDIFTG